MDSVDPMTAESGNDDFGSRPKQKKKTKSWSQKMRPKNGPLQRGFDVRLHFWWGRKMATLFVLRKQKKKQKKFSVEATRLTFMFNYVLLPSVSLVWHPVLLFSQTCANNRRHEKALGSSHVVLPVSVWKQDGWKAEKDVPPQRRSETMYMRLWDAALSCAMLLSLPA